MVWWLDGWFDGCQVNEKLSHALDTKIDTNCSLKLMELFLQSFLV